jgi:hypothetical protein
MIKRILHDVIKQRLYKGKAIVLIGARQVGKTTLLKEIFPTQNDMLWFNADDLPVRDFFSNVTIERYRSMIGKNKIVVIDEAQRIENVGIKMKLITDNFPGIQLVVTGSSSFELANKINEPLTGRKFEYELFPLSFNEMVNDIGLFAEIQKLPIRLVYGMYPDVVCNPGDEKEILNQLTNSYLYKDILEWERIKKPDKLVKLMKALAYQIGSEVSYNELSQIVEIDKGTIEKYINLLEQTKIIFRLPSYSRNLRNELKFGRKIYFCDNGIRNALINNFSDMELRQDAGPLWENFMISELRKYNHYTHNYCNTYFWRTTQKQEIDYIEEKDGKLTAYEFKWNPKKKSRVSSTFTSAYPESIVKTINPDNFYQCFGL